MTTILIVEDEPSILRLQRDLFLSRGFNVLTAQTAAEAMAFIETEHIDVLFADVNIADHGPVAGLELAYIGQAQHDDMAVVLSTGFATAARGDCVRWPVLIKPYLNEIAVETVEKWLAKAKEFSRAARSR